MSSMSSSHKKSNRKGKGRDLRESDASQPPAALPAPGQYDSNYAAPSYRRQEDYTSSGEGEWGLDHQFANMDLADLRQAAAASYTQPENHVYPDSHDPNYALYSDYTPQTYHRECSIPRGASGEELYDTGDGPSTRQATVAAGVAQPLMIGGSSSGHAGFDERTARSQGSYKDADVGSSSKHRQDSRRMASRKSASGSTSDRHAASGSQQYDIRDTRGVGSPQGYEDRAPSGIQYSEPVGGNGNAAAGDFAGYIDYPQVWNEQATTSSVPQASEGTHQEFQSSNLYEYAGDIWLRSHSKREWVWSSGFIDSGGWAGSVIRTTKVLELGFRYKHINFEGVKELRSSEFSFYSMGTIELSYQIGEHDPIKDEFLILHEKNCENWDVIIGRRKAARRPTKDGAQILAATVVAKDKVSKGKFTEAIYLFLAARRRLQLIHQLEEQEEQMRLWLEQQRRAEQQTKRQEEKEAKKKDKGREKDREEGSSRHKH